MTRERQIVEVAKAKEKETGFGELVKSHISRGVNSAYGIGFLEGAEWADEHSKQITLSAADRGIIDEIIFALNSLGKEKMISYDKEIKFLNKILSS